MGVVALNTLFILAGMAGFELLPVYAKNEADVTETMIGIVFFVNTVVIVLAQLPVTKLTEGHRRMRTLASSACCGRAAGCSSRSPACDHGRRRRRAWPGIMAAFGIGGNASTLRAGMLVADLAEPSLMGRYMALSALSWQVGFALGPAIGGFALAASPSGVWFGAAMLCLVASSGRCPSSGRSRPAHGATVPEPAVTRRHRE